MSKPLPARLLSTQEAAQIMRCSIRRVQQLAEESRIPAVKVGPTWVIVDGPHLARYRVNPVLSDAAKRRHHKED